MHPELVSLLRCPVSHTALSLDHASFRDGMVWRGTLRSASGQTWYIRDGIVDLLARSAAWNGAQLVNRLPLAAWSYERLWRPYALSLLSGTDLPLREELAQMTAHLHPARGGVYLDLACSTGVYGRAIARALPAGSGMVVALDHSLAMLRETQRRALSEGLRITLIRALAQELPFKSELLTGVACGGSFNEFTQPDRVLSEVRRTLLPTGRSFWMQARRAPSVGGRALQLLLRSGGLDFQAGDALVRALRSAGLNVVGDERRGAVQFVATRGRILAPAHTDTG